MYPSQKLPQMAMPGQYPYVPFLNGQNNGLRQSMLLSNKQIFPSSTHGAFPVPDQPNLNF